MSHGPSSGTIVVQYGSHDRAAQALRALRRANELSIAFAELPEARLSFTYEFCDWAHFRSGLTGPRGKRGKDRYKCFNCQAQDHFVPQCPWMCDP